MRTDISRGKVCITCMKSARIVRRTKMIAEAMFSGLAWAKAAM